MHKITYFPLGNADTSRIDLQNGKKILVDYAHVFDPQDRYDLRINLAKALKDDLRECERDYYDVVAFTHTHDDHIKGFSDIFYLEHAAKYQGDGRIKINELWVPAAVVMEEGPEDEARILRAEARHRLKEGKGIRVFSRPEKLRGWLEKEGIKFETRKHLITDAGSVVPGFTTTADGVEFFAHCPFAVHVDGGLQDKNESSLILHATFEVDAVETKCFIIGDSTHEVLSDIVKLTRAKHRDKRLSWDIYDIPHHCSYRALSSDKGDDVTEPVPEVEWLLDQGAQKGILIASCKPIPTDDNENLPPHRQAANYYKKVAASKDASFKVTMEHPSKTKPQPIVIEIDNRGAKLKMVTAVGSGAAVSVQAPRAGSACR